MPNGRPIGDHKVISNKSPSQPIARHELAVTHGVSNCRLMSSECLSSHTARSSKGTLPDTAEPELTAIGIPRRGRK